MGLDREGGYRDTKMDYWEIRSSSESFWCHGKTDKRDNSMTGLGEEPQPRNQG